jgi:hypothetical protein
MLDDETKREETVAAVLDQLRQQLGPNLPREMVARVRAHGGEPIATEDAPLTELEGIPVIAADDVGAYVAGPCNLGIGSASKFIVVAC